MRITRDTLLKIARDTAADRIRVSRRVVCIYLTGSCLSEDPLLGGTADIDLVIIEDGQPLQAREVIRLNDEISLDINHYAQEDFLHPRSLRVDPWLGPILYNKPLVLHDSNHWFDYIQASTGSQFLQPDNILARARNQASAARQKWISLGLGGSPDPSSDPARRIYAFYQALEYAGNAIASLSGVPLSERRFLLQLPQKAAATGKPEQPALATSLLALASVTSAVHDADWQSWTAVWDAALIAVGKTESCPPRLLPARRAYYTRAAAALWSDHPAAAFWILMRTFSLAAAHLPAGSESRAALETVSSAVGLDEAHFDARLDDLDQLLDQVEEMLDGWAHRNGVSAE